MKNKRVFFSDIKEIDAEVKSAYTIHVNYSYTKSEMKRLLEKIFGWLKKSNRPKHIKYGLVVFATMQATCIVLGVTFARSAVIALVATATVAVAVDYKDKLWGGKFDWLDVIATMLLPGLITVAVMVLLI